MDDKLQQFIQENRAKGIPDTAILGFLKDKGVLTETGAKASRGVGFEQPEKRQFTGEETLGQAALKTVGNIPRSGAELGKNIFQAVAKPKQTAETIGRLVKGVGEKAGELILEKTPFGQQLLEWANQSRIERGLTPLQTQDGQIQAEGTQDLEALNQVASFFEQRYGSADAIKETVVEDPVGFVADIAGLLTGAGAATRSSKLAQVGRVVEPTSIASKATQGLGKLAGKVKPNIKNISDIAGDVNPITRENIVSGGIVKALDVSPNDVNKFQKATGNTVDDFILNNTTANTTKGIVRELETLKNTSMDEVRSIITQVDKLYDGNEFTRAKQVLETVKDTYRRNKLGNEDIISEIDNLIQKENFNLSDFQSTKEIIDEADLIYKRSGIDEKSGAKARGLSNVRKEIKEFIESEAQSNLGADANVIKELNNKVQSSFELSDMITTRSVKDLTRQQLTVFDLMLGFGGFSSYGVTGAVGLLAGKRLLESPAFRLMMARAVKNLDGSFIKKINSELKAGKLTQPTIEALKELNTVVEDNLGVIEAGSNVLEQAQ